MPLQLHGLSHSFFIPAPVRIAGTGMLLLLLFCPPALHAQVFPDHDPFEVVKSPEQVTWEKEARLHKLRTITETERTCTVSGRDTVISNTKHREITFNTAGQITADSGLSSAVTYYNYDEKGRLSSTTWFGITTDRYVYDKHGRLVMAYSDKHPVDDEKRFYSYDAAGNVTKYSVYQYKTKGKRTDSVCTMRQVRNYDDRGRPLNVSTTFPAAGESSRLTYSYSDTGAVVHLQGSFTLYTICDTAGRVVSTVDSTRKTISRYTYNEAGQPVLYIHESMEDTTSRTRYDYFYTKEGLLFREVRQYASIPGKVYVHTYAYTYY